MASAEYYKNDGIGSLTDGDIGTANYVTVGKNGGAGGTAANPYVVVSGARSTNIASEDIS